MDSPELTSQQLTAIRSCVNSLGLMPAPAYMLQWLFGKMDDHYKVCLGTRKTSTPVETIKQFRNSYHAIAAAVSLLTIKLM